MIPTASQRPRLEKLAIVSPHRDDAAFSCGLLISLCVRNGIAITIANIFTTSAYAPYVSEGRDLQDGECSGCSIGQITHIRRKEDEALMHHLGPASQMLDFGLEDAPVRFNIPAERVVEDPLSTSAFKREVDQLALQLRSLRDFDLILLPLGIGEHVDHCIAREAGRLALPPSRVGFYEDLPYAARMESPGRDAHLRQIGIASSSDLEALVLVSSDGVEMKSRYVSLYRSQISHDVVKEISGYAASIGDGERFYLPPAIASAIREVFGARKVLAPAENFAEVTTH